MVTFFVRMVACILSLLFGYMWVVVADDHASNAVKLNAEVFTADTITMPHFVMFFAPWCGHCKRLAPTWEDLALKHNQGEEKEVVIGKVDCTVETALCSDHDVTGYPTLKFFKKGSTDGVKYRGPRDENSLQNFINEQLGKAEEPDHEEEEEDSEIPEVVDGLVELTDKTFYKQVEEGQNFVKFYAPWCGHCQKLAPTWDALAHSLEQDMSVTIARVDCTQYRSVCNDFDVKGYPTLLWIKDGKKVEKYQGSRTHEDLKEFVSRMMDKVDEGKVSEDGKVPDRSSSSSPVVTLTSENFGNGISTGVSFVKFFAPWCGHCKRMAPIWEELGGKFADSTAVKVVKVDCTLDINKGLCNEQGVDGFPSLFLYRDGDKLEEYVGSRSLEDLHEFVHKHLRHDEL